MIISFIFILLFTFYIYFFFANKRDKFSSNIKVRKEHKCSINKSEEWGAFCVNKNHPYIGSNFMLDKGLAEEIGKTFQNYSIIDLGAGLGQYCKVINKYTTCHPYDGSKNIEFVTNGTVKFLNLAKRIDFGCLHDVVISIEVGEHIPKVYENIFIDNLIKCSRIYIIITWARKGQGGFYHINEKNKDEVIKIFLSKGLIYEDIIYNRLYNHSKIYYIKNNLMIFKKNSTKKIISRFKNII